MNFHSRLPLISNPVKFIVTMKRIQKCIVPFDRVVVTSSTSATFLMAKENIEHCVSLYLSPYIFIN